LCGLSIIDTDAERVAEDPAFLFRTEKMISTILSSFEAVTGLPEFIGYIFVFGVGAMIGSFHPVRG